MPSVYPEGVGINLSYQKFSHTQVKSLKQNLPKNVLIRVYGLAGVGKGTLSKMLAETLEIPNLESSLILRCVTHIYLDKDFDLTETNTDLVFKNFKIEIKNQQLNFTYKSKILPKEILKAPIIDKNITKYSSNLYVRKKFDQSLSNLVQKSLKSAAVADGRGSHEPYLIEAEKNNFLVIRVLLDAKTEIKAERYYENFVKIEKAKNPDFQETESKKQAVLKEFEKNILDRDQKDVQNILDKKIGLISEDTGVIDTSFLTPNQVLETVLNFVQKKISNQN